MKYLAITLIVLLIGCSKAPDYLSKILSLAAQKKEQEKVLTPNEKELIKDADNKEWENADDNKQRRCASIN